MRPHPAYQLGWGRVSCVACIFGDSDQWAIVNKLDPERFWRIADVKRRFGTTIKKGQSVEEMARQSKGFLSDKPEELGRLVLSPDAFTAEMLFLPEGEIWRQPAGAYRRCGGPT